MKNVTQNIMLAVLMICALFSYSPASADLPISTVAAARVMNAAAQIGLSMTFLSRLSEKLLREPRAAIPPAGPSHCCEFYFGFHCGLRAISSGAIFLKYSQSDLYATAPPRLL